MKPKTRQPYSTEDRTRRCERDARLRVCGFQIYARPKVGEPRWTRGGQVYAESAAVRLADLEMEQAIEEGLV